MRSTKGSFSRRRLLESGALLAAGCAAPAEPATDGRLPPEPDEGAVRARLRAARTRFAVNVEMWWRGLPFEERLREAAALGFEAVELWGWRPKDVDRIAAVRSELGIEVAQLTGWGFSPPLNDAANRARFLEEIEASCRVANRLGAGLLTVVAGDERPGASREEMRAAVVAGLRAAAPIAADHGVVLILEPMNVRVDHPGHFLYGSPEALAIAREVDSPAVKLNWDLYHMQVTEGDLCGRLREGFDQVGYLQLADHPGRHEPGTGEIRYERVLAEARELGYAGFVGLECTPSGSELEAALACAAAGA